MHIHMVHTVCSSQCGVKMNQNSPLNLSKNTHGGGGHSHTQSDESPVLSEGADNDACHAHHARKMNMGFPCSAVKIETVWVQGHSHAMDAGCEGSAARLEVRVKTEPEPCEDGNAEGELAQAYGAERKVKDEAEDDVYRPDLSEDEDEEKDDDCRIDPLDYLEKNEGSYRSDSSSDGSGSYQQWRHHTGAEAGSSRPNGNAPPRSPWQMEQKPYECEICGKYFTSRSNIKRHKRYHAGDRPFKCTECNKRFATSSHLSVHSRTHTGDKPYQCKECGKCFSINSNLNVHLRTHTGEKPYQCKICSKRFATSGVLSKHTKTHTGDKPYECVQCGKCFSVNNNLTKHMSIHSNEKTFKCIFCIRSFRTKEALNRHLKMHARNSYHCDYQ